VEMRLAYFRTSLSLFFDMGKEMESEQGVWNGVESWGKMGMNGKEDKR